MKRLLLAFCMLVTVTSMMAEKGTLVLRTPREYQVMYISANGKWAAGVYYDYYYTPYAFRWNLESGEINLLSTLESSNTSGISNEGVVTGNYAAKDIASNGATVDAPGYYDTRWHTLPLHGEYVGGSDLGVSMGGGISGGISPDGHWMAGASFISGNMHPVIWKDGEFEKDLWDGTEGVPYCISSDGKHIAGWKYVNGENYGTRFACIWLNGSQEAEILSNYGSPWCTGQMFSPNGEKMLFWGGWADLDPNSEPRVKALYDMATGEVSTLLAINDNPADHNLCSISDDGTILGYERGEEDASSRATIYKGETGYWAVDYLRDNGIYDFYTDPYIYNEETDEGTLPLVIRAMGISADAKAMGFFHYEPEGYYQSCVLLLDQEITHRAPCGLKVAQIDGNKDVRVAWRKPLTNAENVARYNIYRNGEKIGETASDNLLYFDTTVSLGTYEYAITAVYNDGTESDPCDAASATVDEKKWEPVYAILARQNGFNNASMIWNKPLTNKVKKSYYDTDDEIYGFGAANQSFELAVCFDKADIMHYEGGQITGVTFYPMSTQMGWKATVYELDDNMNQTIIKEQRITQDLILGEMNVVMFDTPITISGNKNIAVGITANVSDLTASNNVIGMTYGKCIPGRTDLLRNISGREQKFYSFYDYSQDNAVTNETTWAISMIIDNDDDDDIDRIAGYNIYADGTLVATTDTEHAKVENLAEGRHTFGVEVLYANGETGAVQTTDVDINVNTQTYAVNKVDAENSADNKSIDFSWEAPVDNDRQFLAYCDDVPGNQNVRGNEEEDWALQAMVVYNATTLKPYVGSQIKKFRFYPTCEAGFTFSLILNGDIIAYEEATDYKVKQWNEVELEEPITILPGLEYMVMLDCQPVAEGSPLGLDGNSPFTGTSDLVATNGINFGTLAENGIFGNWMLGMVTESEETTPLPITGYDIRIDGEKKNSETIGTTTFTLDASTLAEGRHEVNVDVKYTAMDTPVEGATNYFVNTTDGIKDVVKWSGNEYNYNVAGQRLGRMARGIVVKKKEKRLSR